MCFGCSKNRIIETVVLSIHNIYFLLRIRKNNFLLRTLICGTGELPPLTCINHVLLILLKVNFGANSKRSSRNTPKFHLFPAYTKTHVYVEKINSITRSISKFISLIYFSIKMTIKE